MIIDGTDLILGRLSTFVAKKALLGEKVDIVNCENIIITGAKENIFKKYKRLRDLGDHKHGPYVSRMSDRFVRKVIKRMLPFKQDRGRKAFKNIMCYLGVPDQFKSEKIETVKNINVSKVPSLKYITIGKLCNLLGGKL